MASTSTASPRLEATQLPGRSAALLSRLPTVAGNSIIHPATPAVERAVRTTELAESVPPRLRRSTRHVLIRPARAVEGRCASARRAAEASDAFDAARPSRAAKQAKHMASWTPALPGLTYLLRNSVTDETRQSFLKLITDFPRFWRSEVSPHRVGEPTSEVIHGAPERYMEEVFKRGQPSQRGSRLMGVIKGLNPIFGRDGNMTLPFAMSTLQPMHTGMITTGLYVMLRFTAYLRPSEPFCISGKRLVGPVPGTCHKYWSVTLHPWEDGWVNKELHVVKTVLIDLNKYQFITKALRFLKSVTPDAEYAFLSSQAQARARCQRAYRAAKLEMPKPVLYQLRHSGPCHDKAPLLRTLAEIRDRGRCGTDITGRRYKKKGRVAQQRQKLLPSARVAAMAAPAQLAEASCQLLTAPLPR